MYHVFRLNDQLYCVNERNPAYNDFVMSDFIPVIKGFRYSCIKRLIKICANTRENALIFN